jgi:hypothetical protein
MGWATFWAIFSQNHLVTLLSSPKEEEQEVSLTEANEETSFLPRYRFI